MAARFRLVKYYNLPRRDVNKKTEDLAIEAAKMEIYMDLPIDDRDLGEFTNKK